MDIAQLLGALPAQLIPLAIFAYVFNLSHIKWMAERREIIEALAADREEIIASLATDRKELIAAQNAERKEWQETQRATIERQFTLGERIATALEAARAESHAFRNKVQEVLMRYEMGATPKQDRRTGNRGVADGEQ